MDRKTLDQKALATGLRWCCQSPLCNLTGRIATGPSMTKHVETGWLQALSQLWEHNSDKMIPLRMYVFEGAAYEDSKRFESRGHWFTSDIVSRGYIGNMVNSDRGLLSPVGNLTCYASARWYATYLATCSQGTKCRQS